jgi:hypothetical protein
MKGYLTAILLCFAIWLIASAIHTHNLILLGVGGFLAGVYNTMMYYKKKIKGEINVLFKIRNVKRQGML